MKALFFICLLLLGTQGKTQTGAEWVRQKKTQLRYLQNQIAANRVYLDYLAAGYKITQQATAVIRSVKKGDLDLHQLSFNLLKQLNPSIKHYSKLIYLVRLQWGTVHAVQQLEKSIAVAELLQPGEKQLILQKSKGIRESCLDNIGFLLDLVDKDASGMTDGERIERIEKLCGEINLIGSALRLLVTESMLLCQQRQTDLKEIDFSKTINTVP